MEAHYIPYEETTIMEGEFIPYEQALELKELGFNEGCLTYYFIGGKMSNYFKRVHRNNKLLQSQPYSFHCTAPLYQQAFTFFRNTFKTDSVIKPVSVDDELKYAIDITDLTKQLHPTGRHNAKYFDSYDEAKLDCIKKLIELCKKS